MVRELKGFASSIGENSKRCAFQFKYVHNMPHSSDARLMIGNALQKRVMVEKANVHMLNKTMVLIFTQVPHTLVVGSFCCWEYILSKCQANATCLALLCTHPECIYCEEKKKSIAFMNAENLKRSSGTSTRGKGKQKQST